jgi:hypothetical protein
MLAKTKAIPADKDPGPKMAITKIPISIVGNASTTSVTLIAFGGKLLITILHLSYPVVCGEIISLICLVGFFPNSANGKLLKSNTCIPIYLLKLSKYLCVYFLLELYKNLFLILIFRQIFNPFYNHILV